MIKQEKHSVIRAFSGEYRKARKPEKTIILNKLSKITGYSRKHLMEILPNPPSKRPHKRSKVSPYLPVLKTLKKLWAVSNYACGKRLAPMIPVYLASLGRFHELPKMSKEEKKLLIQISPATIDRLLTHDRRRINLKSRSRTKPGSLLKNQIPIRTFADWKDEEKTPGFLEIDTVHHCGDDPRGDYVHSLDTTDVFTGWNKCRAFMGKSERHTVKGCLEIPEKTKGNLKQRFLQLNPKKLLLEITGPI